MLQYCWFLVFLGCWNEGQIWLLNCFLPCREVPRCSWLPRLCFKAVQWCRTSGRDLTVVFVRGLQTSHNLGGVRGVEPGALLWFVLQLQPLLGRRGLETTAASSLRGAGLGWASPATAAHDKHDFQRGIPVPGRVGVWVCTSKQWEAALVCSCLRFSLVTVLQPSLISDFCSSRVNLLPVEKFRLVLVFLTTFLWTLLLFFVNLNKVVAVILACLSLLCVFCILYFSTGFGHRWDRCWNNFTTLFYPGKLLQMEEPFFTLQ